MKIICAGLAKTGTTSLAAALRILGFSVHDFLEHISYNADTYLKAIDGEMPDFVAMYEDVDATTDSPPCFFWKELHESFPNAKVILTERDNVEEWAESKIAYGKLNLKLWKKEFWLPMAVTPTGWKIDKLFMKLFHLYGRHKRDQLRSIYLEHNARVKAFIPRDKLLVFNVKQGWKPLCEFLGVDVPDVPFPKLQSRADKESTENELLSMFRNSEIFIQLWKEFGILMTILAVMPVAIGLFIYRFR